MKNLLLLLGLFFSISLQGQKAPDLEGRWDGKAYIQETTVDFLFVITKDNKNCTVTIPVNQFEDLPANSFTVDNENQVAIQFAKIKASFTGEYDSNKKTIQGTWKQGSLSLDLTLRNLDAKGASAYRPQTPSEPFPYLIEEVKFKNVEEEGVELAGTLTLPEKGKTLATLVLISGSGPQDRDETIFDHKPFWVIADYFTRRGYAVLRYDDRGIGKSTGTFPTATTADFAEDTKAAVNYLQSREDLDPNRIILVGHSEGGMIAQMVAAEREDIAMVVSLAGPGIPCADLLVLQNDALGTQAGFSEKKLARNRNFNQKIYEICATDLDGNDFNNKIRYECNGFFEQMDEEEKKAYGNNKHQFYFKTVLGINTPWFRYFSKYDPYPYLLKIKQPFLALNGSKDLQVTAQENLDGIETALEEGICTDFKTIELESLNHLFQKAETGDPSEYQNISETFSIEALEEMLKFISRRLKLIRK